ncbi:DUF4197 domain-containing protein [Parafilimonas sp.]|uniref:DUF4197 domain-containing protein n=1 Tax=Parafilimonas sp. TaxID=1969739 RepID=UPI0039E40F95
MKKLFTICLFASTFFLPGCGTIQNVAGSLSGLEISQGLKEALTKGLFSGFEAFSNPAQGNALVRFAFPGEAAKIEKTLKDLGLTAAVNNVTSKYTNAMSLAVKSAQPVFLDAVKNMSFRDAASILLSANRHAATEYFKSSMSPQLMTAFRPIVDSTVRTTGAGNEYGNIVKAYNAIPFISKKLEPSLNDFIAARAIDAMFLYMADKEADIRSNAAARTTPLLQRVFGYADAQQRIKAAGN